MRAIPFRSVPLVFAIIVTAALPYLAGCGGASPSTNPLGTTPGGTTRGVDRTDPLTGGAKTEAERGKLGVFVTATGILPGYDRIWADIRKIELLDADEKTTVIFDDTDGFLTDLNLLADSRAPRFALLTVGAVSTGKSYTRARVTFGKAFALMPMGAPTAQTLPLSDTVGRDATDMPELTVPLEKPRNFGDGKQNLVLAFDLTKMLVKDGRVTPTLKEGPTDGLGAAGRQEPSVFVGAVSELHSGEKETTFTLSFGPNRSVTATATDATVYSNATATPNPTLKEGVKIAARGTLQPETKRFVVRQVEVYGETAPPAETAMIRGPIESADAKTSTLTLSPDQIRGMMPTFRALTVQLTADAVLRGPGGLLLTADQFFDALKAPHVRVAMEGIYEPVTGAFRSTKARLADADNAPAFAAAVEGTPKDANSADGKLMVTAPTEWQGITVRESGKSVPVATTPATLYSDEKGDPLTAAHFYAALKEGDHAVRIVGLYANGLLAATRAELRPPAPKPEPKVADTKEGGKTDALKPEAAKTDTARKPDEGEVKKDGDKKDGDPKPAEEKKDPGEKPAPAPAPEPAII